MACAAALAASQAVADPPASPPAVSAVAAPPSGAPSANDLTKAPAIQDVSLSPDGKHMVALTSPDGTVVDITVWSTAALGAQPVRIRSKFMRFIAVGFAKNDRLLFTAVQPDTVEGVPRHLVKQYVTDLEGKTFSPLLPDHSVTSEQENDVDQLGGARLISDLRMDPRKVLVVDQRLGHVGDIYKVDVYDMSAERVMQGSERYSDYQVDLKGELRARSFQDFDGPNVYIAQQYRDPDTGQWVELFRNYARTSGSSASSDSPPTRTSS